MTIDGRQKQYHDTTYENVRKIFQRIQESGFLDKIYLNDKSLPNMDFDKTNALEKNDTKDVQTDNEKKDNKDNNEGTIGDGTAKPIRDPSRAITPKTLGNPVINKTSLQSNENSGALVKTSLHGQPVVKQNTAVNTNASTKNTAVQKTGQSVLNAPMQNITGLSPPLTAHGLQVGGNFVTDNHETSGQKINQGRCDTKTIKNNSTFTTAALGDNRPMQENALRNTTNQVVAPVTIPVPYNPTTVNAVEQTFFNQHSQKQKRQQQFIQQMRPLSEVLGGGSFYFLQDSELDVPQSPNLPNSSIFEQLKIPTMQQHQSALPPLVQESNNKLNQKAQKLSGKQISSMHNNNPNDIETVGVSVGSGSVSVNQNTALLQQQIIRLQEQQQQPLISTHIHTQTFTNQSFPQVTPSQSSLGSNTPSPLFHQKQALDSHPLFSPDAHGIPSPFQQNSTPAQLIIGNDQQQPEQSMIIMGQMNPSAPTGVGAQNSDSLFKTQTAAVTHQLDQQQKAYQQHMNTTDMTQKNLRFPYDNAVVTAYEQQLQQLTVSNALKTDSSMIIAVNNDDSKIVKGNVVAGKTSDLLTDWCESKSLDTNSTFGMHTVPLDTKSESAIMVNASKWVDLDATTSAVSVHHMNIGPSSNVIRKNDWVPNVSVALTTTDTAGGYSLEAHNKGSQWPQHDTNYNRDPTGTRISAAAVGAAATCGTATSSPYQRRNDDRRLAGVNLNNYRGNNRSNYNAAPIVQQQSTGTGRNNVSGNNANATLNNMYYRGEGNNSYYQNGVASTNTIGSANNTTLITAAGVGGVSVTGGAGAGSGGHIYANNRTQRNGCVVQAGANTNMNNNRNNSGAPSRNMGFNRGSAGK